MRNLKYSAAVIGLVAAPVAAQTSMGNLPAATSAVGRGIVSAIPGASNSSKLVTPAQIVAAVPACANITVFGGDPTDRIDNTPAMAFAKAAAASPGQMCVYLPAGKYKFTTPQTFSLSPAYSFGSITLLGDGLDVTSLDFADGTSGLNFQLNTQHQSVHVRDLSILAGTASNSTIAIAIQQNQASVPYPAYSSLIDISNVSIHGNDGIAATNTFGAGITLIGASNVNVTSTIITCAGGRGYGTSGVGIRDGGTSAIIPVVLNITDSTVNYCGTGFVYGDNLQGVTIKGSNFTGVGIGVSVPAGEVNLDQLAIDGSQFNANVADVSVGSIVVSIQMGDNDFYIAGTNTSALQLTHPGLFTIHDNAIIGLGTNNTGIVVGNYDALPGTITGNPMFRLHTGIWLQSASRSVKVRSNAFKTVTTWLLNDGAGNDVDVIGSDDNTWSAAQHFTTIDGQASAPPLLAAQAGAGAGATVVCKTGYRCDNISGTLTLSTGTATATGNQFAVTFPTVRAFPPNCSITASVPLMQGANNPANLLVASAAPLAASTAYTVTYTCFGD